MGTHDVDAPAGGRERRAFVKALLDDVQALERMLDEDLIETGVRRIGVEQEYFLVDAGGHAAPVSLAVLDELDDPAFTTELAKFNLEANGPPHPWGGDCLRRMEADLDGFLSKARAAANKSDADVLLTGILPTLRVSDLDIEHMTPAPRYYALNDAVVRMRGPGLPIRIKGIDEFYAVAENVMLEGCNTSFQIHFQVAPDEFADLYNLAQAITAPVLAGAVNSPVLLERRLWEETRVALFQHSVDDRSLSQMTRGGLPRVRFGESWVKESVLELFREDIARFRVVLATDTGENSLDVLDRGEVPALAALCLHNGTVWRWNRACYGVGGGKAHLRIENRVLPAGPTVVDQMANAAFYYGLMIALRAEYKDITKVMSFNDAKTNFMAAARRGLKAQFSWIRGRSTTASALILDELLPLARAGLADSGIDPEDVARYLGVYEERVRSRQTGAQWAMDSFSAMGERGSRHERLRALTMGTLARQKEGKPVHTWTLAELGEAVDWRRSYQTVGLFMTTDLFTVRPDDVVDLAANLMEWKHIRHVPVEDEEGKLVGMLSHRDVVKLLAQGLTAGKHEPVAVRSIMTSDVITVTPETETLDALDKIRKHRVACLPVVRGEHLVGIVTERDFLDAAGKIFEHELRRGS